MAIIKTYTCDRCSKTSEPRIDIFYVNNVEHKEITYPDDWMFVELDPPAVEKSVKVLLCDNCSEKFRDVMINFLLSKEETENICCNCHWYEGVKAVPGTAPCSKHNKQVLWNEDCDKIWLISERLKVKKENK